MRRMIGAVAANFQFAKSAPQAEAPFQREADSTGLLIYRQIKNLSPHFPVFLCQRKHKLIPLFCLDIGLGEAKTRGKSRASGISMNLAGQLTIVPFHSLI